MHVAGVLELRLVAKGLVLGTRCTSVSLRNKWTALVGKLLRRISSSIHFILHKWSTGQGSAGSLGTAEQAEKDRDIACESLVMLLWMMYTETRLCAAFSALGFSRRAHLHTLEALHGMCGALI